MKKILLIPIVLFTALILPHQVRAADFDELDKPPEGAHKGQMLFGAFVSVGQPFGKLMTAENDFLTDTIYTFQNDVTKVIEVSHISFGFGLSYEYMPIDYLGLKTKFKRTSIMQRSNFGPDYENWRGPVYRDFSFYFGPSGHLTTRKTWDFTLTPIIGFAIATYNAAPVGSQIIFEPAGDEDGQQMTGNNERKFVSFTYGAELNCTIYFSKGLYVSLGCDWTRNPCSFGNAIGIVNPQQTSNKYASGAKSGTIDSVSFIITAGYALYN